MIRHTSFTFQQNGQADDDMDDINEYHYERNGVGLPDRIGCISGIAKNVEKGKEPERRHP